MEVTMITFELTEHEAALLYKILEGYHSDLTVEMAVNGIEDLAPALRTERTLMQTMLAQLQEQGIGILKPEMLGEYAA